MKGYSSYVEGAACARAEGVNASYKDLAEVCGRIRGMDSGKAVSFLEKASQRPEDGGVPVLFKRHCKKLGHRRELGGRKGRYPWKAAAAVLKVLQSAIANGRVRGMGESYEIAAALANKKMEMPRLASKGRWARSNLETSRIEIVLKGSEVPKGVSVKAPAKQAPKPETVKARAGEQKAEAPAVGKPAVPPVTSLKEEAEAHEHKHGQEKATESEKKHEEAQPHHHGEYKKR